MSTAENEKTAPGCARTESGIMSGECATSSGSDCTIILPHEQGKIERLLQHGSDHAVKSDELCRALDLSERRLRAEVYRERDAGAVILSDTNGYFLPAPGTQGNAEILKFAAREHKRGLCALHTESVLLRAVHLDGQIAMNAAEVINAETQTN